MRFCLRGHVSGNMSSLSRMSVRVQLYMGTLQMVHRTNSIGNLEYEENFDMIMIVQPDHRTDRAQHTPNTRTV